MELISAINKIAERTFETRKDISQKNKQRRVNFVDLYGQEYTRQGDGGSPIKFYISISPDLIYYERFEFKLIISSFISTVSSTSMQSATVVVDSETVSVNEATLHQKDGYVDQEKHTHTTKSHTHTTQPHSHNVISGVNMVPVAATNFRISIEGIDITPYLMAQHDGEWITGEGIFPSDDLEGEEKENVYDVLQVASDMMAEGNVSNADKILKPGYKRVEISANAPFQCTLVNYLKYSHMNR